MERLSQPGDGTRFNHAMIRVKDPKASLAFYQDHFKMQLVNVGRHPEAKFDVYFLSSVPDGTCLPEAGTPEAHRSLQAGEMTALELTHNYGTETDAAFAYNNGNVEPHRGFGHVGFIVDDIEAFCAGLESAGVKFKKRLADGAMKNIAFALDPDGYWVEILSRSTSVTTTGGVVGKPSFQQVMLRVVDPVLAVAWYERHVGLSLVCRRDFPAAKFSLYFLGSFPGGTRLPADPSSDEAWEFATSVSTTLLELTHNHGTEGTEFRYHNGNTEPRGFGHLAFVTDDLAGKCEALEAAGVTFTKRPLEGRMRNIAFCRDADGYLVEIIQRS